MGRWKSCLEKSTIRSEFMKPALAKMFDEARAAGRSALDEPAAKRVLAAYGVAVPRGVASIRQKASLLDGLKAPLAAKLISPDASHKSDVGGVRLALPDAAAAAIAVRELARVAEQKNLEFDGVLVEEKMAPPAWSW